MLRHLVRVPRESDFTSRLRGPEVASRVGLWLGVAFALAFVTGLYSHLAQEPMPWLPLPTRPAWLYRVTQGVHVASGTAAVPLLVVKLWTVFPRLFARPPWRVRRRLVAHVLERGSIALLVAAAIFLLATGVANVTQWYPWPFSFRATHYAVAWLAVGALLVHVAVKLPVAARALRSDVDVPGDGAEDGDGAGGGDRAGDGDRPGGAAREAAGNDAGSHAGLTRRGLLRATGLAATAAAVTTAGAVVPGLRSIAVFSPRSGNGPGGIPINTTARQARVTASATSADFTLTLAHGSREISLTRADLEAMPQRSATLPIACVEGWSADGRWTGVPVRDLVALLSGTGGHGVVVSSLQEGGPFRETRLPPEFVDDPDTLLALRLGGEPLSIDHGYPCRIIAPNRPGVLQTKWVARLEVET
jgi:hypothetical protein